MILGFIKQYWYLAFDSFQKVKSIQCYIRQITGNLGHKKKQISKTRVIGELDYSRHNSLFV